MDLQNFILTSDYPIDKVIYRSSIISLSIPAFDFNSLVVPHDSGGEFLPITQYSLDPNFLTNVYDLGVSPAGAGIPQRYNTSLSVTASDISISVNNNTASNVTLYFRITGLSVPGTNREVQPTSQYQDLVLNTDLSYMKLVLEDTIPTVNNQNVTAEHALGYVPKVLIWQKITGFGGDGISQITALTRDFSAPDNGTVVRINSEILTIINLFGTTVTYYYKIYG